MSIPVDTAPVIAYEPNCSIKEELGEEFLIAELITEEKIAACASLLERATDDFFIDALADLKQLEELMQHPYSSTASEQFQVYVYNIKSLGKVLGFSLITEICVHCLAAVKSERLPQKKKWALLKKLVEALRLAFVQRIRDDGGTEGKALLSSLRKYIG